MPMIEYFIHLRQQYYSDEIKLVFSSDNEIPPRRHHFGSAYLFARRLAPLLAGLAADGHFVRPHVRCRTGYDGQKSRIIT